ncbi:MAG: NAD(+) diphosphatase [Candidatus Nanopelagicales bacterium]
MGGPPDDVDLSLLTDLALARGSLDRAADLRADEAALDAAWADPATRVLLVDDGNAPVVDDGSGVRLVLVDPGRVPRRASVEHTFLGRDHDGVHYFVARPEGAMLAPPGAAWASLRDVGADLDERDVGLLTAAVALDNWHDRHRRCPICGTETVLAQAGWVRRCPEDGSEHYPRTDPAVIVLVRDPDDRALLGRQARWPEGWFSTLAGFVEPGESAEQAVRREVAEEAGVVVGAVAYLGSQPWPFPSSLMLGYHAWAVDPSVQVDGEEIVEARWFTRAGLVEACESGEVRLPPAVSIARRLVERWYGGPLPGAWSRPLGRKR